MSEGAWWKKYLAPLVGRKIVKVGVLKNFAFSEFPVPYFELDDGLKVVALMDEEGNGPGHLVGVSPKKGKTK